MRPAPQTTDTYVGRKIVSRRPAHVLNALGDAKTGSSTETQPTIGVACACPCVLWAAWGSNPEPKD
jgi:hypothetical protein